MFDWLKRRKHQKSGASPPLPPCKHVWKDFPWYIEGVYDLDYNAETITIYEPYVCVHCKERKDVILLKVNRYVENRKEGSKILGGYIDEFKSYLVSRPIVEDMINDFIYVDREKLELLENLYKISKEKGNG